VFWLAIAGNNARHVIPFAVPLVWLAPAWLQRFGVPRMAAVTALAIAGNLVVPANSGVSLYPSANVPHSAALMAERQQELRLAATRLLSGDAPTACYVGRTTQDYVTHYVLERADAAGDGVEVLPQRPADAATRVSRRPAVPPVGDDWPARQAGRRHQPAKVVGLRPRREPRIRRSRDAAAILRHRAPAGRSPRQRAALIRHP
jgi:hypothetical protein